MDNPLYFTELWTGFKSGKVRLSIEATDYVGEYANFCVSKVWGIDLSATEMVDDVAPVITIDTPYETMPVAKVGADYAVPTATAVDEYSGDCKVDVHVYTNYNSATPREVKITDGKFRCASMLQHAIEYVATDVMGNVAKTVLYVQASNEVPAPVININGSQTDTETVGLLYKPLDCTVQSSSGIADVKIFAKIGDYEQEISKDGFRPEKEGTYTIKYVATDYVGQTSEKSYTVVAEISDEPIFIDSPILPDVFISGYEYKLPDLYAYDYRSGEMVKKPAFATIVDANGQHVVEFGATFTPVVANSGDKIQITYECDGAKLETINASTVVIWNTLDDGSQELDLAKMFLSNDNSMTAVAKDDNVTLTTKTENGSWTFANYMIAGNFTFQLKGIAGKTRYSQIDVIMRDSVDPSIAICASLINNGSKKTDIIVNGVKVGLEGALNSGFVFRIGYDDGSVTVGNAKVAVTKTIDGKDFVGFPSNKLQFSVQLVGATVGDAYQILDVNGHSMNNFTIDRVGPRIVVMGNYGGSFNINDIVTIPAAMASDVVCPSATLTMTVADAEGNALTSIDGIELKNIDPSREYQVKLDTFGKYSVRLVSKDTNASANTSRFNYALNVEDSVGPQIEFKAGFHHNLKVGDFIVIPQFNVSDNITTADKLIITKYIYTPSGLLITIPSNSNSLKVSQAGEYEVRIIVMDEAGNIAVSRETINVTNE